MDVLPLVVSPTVTHYVYIRKHQAKAGSIIPGDRTLFASNLPVDCTERQWTRFFKAHGCGSIEKMVFEGGGDSMQEDEGVQLAAPTSKVVPLPPSPPPLRVSGQTAHIIFLDESSLSMTLSLPKNKFKKYKWPPSPGEDGVPTGLARFTAMFDARHPPLSVARDHVDTYMEDYEKKVETAKLAAAQLKYKKGEAIVDQDGFTLVTRGGAYGATLGGRASVASKKFQLAANSGAVHAVEKQKRKKKEKPDFYTFQIREKKRQGDELSKSLICVYER
jgi:ribosomal RNA-processing protein 7